MNQKDFAAQALQTESRLPFMEVGQAEKAAVLSILRAIIELGGALDIFKKYMFYRKEVIVPSEKAGQDSVVTYKGKPLNLSGAQNRLIEASRHTTDAARSLLEVEDGKYNQPVMLAVSPSQLRIAHGIIGKMTEGVELGEIMVNMVETGELDIVHLGEEMADDDWYNALILDAAQLDEGRLRQAVIKKLQDKQIGRYREGFSPEASANRDVAVERAGLEASLS